jgi:hypothetical protein
MRPLFRIKPGYGGWVQADGDDALPPGTSILVRFELDEELNRLVPVELHVDTVGQRLSPGDIRRLSLETIEVFANYTGKGGIRDIIEDHLRTPVDIHLPLRYFPAPHGWAVGLMQEQATWDTATWGSATRSDGPARPATVEAKASIPSPIVTDPLRLSVGATDSAGLTDSAHARVTPAGASLADSGTASDALTVKRGSAAVTARATVTAEGRVLAEAAKGSGAAFDARIETVAPLTTPPDGRYTAEWFNQLRDAYVGAWTAWRHGGGEAPAKALANQARVSVRTVHSWLYRARHASVEIPGQQQGQGGRDGQ